MFRIKICGITSGEDAIAARDFGADALGLNFYEPSPRSVLPDKLDIRPFPIGVVRVGVFVNADVDVIEDFVGTFDLMAIQLHGDEPPVVLKELPDCFVIRARRMDERGVAPIAEDLEACQAAGRMPDAVLVDALTPGRYGGTGETVSWAGLADYRKWLGDVPLILAGGLTPENVAEAIRTVRPYGVDVASGVESSPGVKDHKKMLRFIEAAREAFAAID